MCRTVSTVRPVGMGDVIHCSLAKDMLDCVVECPEGQNQQAWEAAVGGLTVGAQLLTNQAFQALYQAMYLRSYHCKIIHIFFFIDCIQHVLYLGLKIMSNITINAKIGWGLINNIQYYYLLKLLNHFN